MIDVKFGKVETSCSSSGEDSKEEITITTSARNMRKFLVIDKKDGHRILRYLLLVVAVMVISLVLLHYSKDDLRRQAEEVSRLKPAYSTRLQPIDNFYDFPCFPHLISSQTLKWHGKCVRTINLGAINFGIKLDERCQFVPINKRPTICTYKPLRKNVSLFINEEGRRNRQYINTMLKMIEVNRKMYFFDVSMGDGEYCVAAAAHTNRTVCMNGNYKTVIMLLKSVIMKRTHDNIRFVWNILRDKHEVVTLDFYNSNTNKLLPDGNVETFSSLALNKGGTYDVNSVTLDDLTGIFKGQPVFMKLDLDSTDVSVFLSGDRFLRLVNLSVLQIVTKDKDKAIRIAELLEYHGFLPYNDPFQKRHIKGNEKWPRNVYYMK